MGQAVAGNGSANPVPTGLTGSFAAYEVGDFYDELFEPAGCPRRECEVLFSHLQRLSSDDLQRRQRAADRSMLGMGITFNVYGDGQGTERIIPFDIVPRIFAPPSGMSSNAGSASGSPPSTCSSTTFTTTSGSSATA